MALLIEAGLVDGQMSKALNQEVIDFLARRLTWDGHEFLDSIRNDTIWEKMKKGFVDKGVEMTFELVKTFAKDAADALMKGFS